MWVAPPPVVILLAILHYREMTAWVDADELAILCRRPSSPTNGAALCWPTPLSPLDWFRSSHCSCCPDADGGIVVDKDGRWPKDRPRNPNRISI